MTTFSHDHMTALHVVLFFAGAVFGVSLCLFANEVFVSPYDAPPRAGDPKGETLTDRRYGGWAMPEHTSYVSQRTCTFCGGAIVPDVAHRCIP